MSLLVKGKWRDGWLKAETEDGEFIRHDSQFRHWITADGSAGPSGEGGFVAESGRYHLYISHACPWANRTLIFRELKGLGALISVSVVNPIMGPKGWDFTPFEGATEDHLYAAQHMHELYTRSQADYTGIVTVPVLWDKKQQCIVNNESSEIIRMFNSAFNHLTGNENDYYPAPLHTEIDEVNKRVYDTLNNGVYRCGFASSQKAYERAFDKLFDTLDWLEERLSKQRYLVGKTLTEADWRLFTTLVRFDPVYVGHFKCNRQRIADYPNLSNYLRELYQMPGIADTVNLVHIKQHYYRSHESINPSGIVPKGPSLQYDQPHDRHQFPV